MQAYASPNDLIERHDVDVLGDLATDDRVRLSRLDVSNHTNVFTALQDATGEVQVALLRGGKYRPEQLAELQGPQLSHLKRIVCWVAMALLFERRPGVHTDKADKYLERAQTYLVALQRGDNVFGLDEARLDAGRPTVGGMTSVEYDKTNLLPERCGRFFPETITRLPRDRG